MACVASSNLRTVPAGTGTEDQLTIVFEQHRAEAGLQHHLRRVPQGPGGPDAAFQLRSIEQQTNFVAQTALYPNNLSSTLTRTERGTYSGTFSGTSTATATHPAATLNATFHEVRM
ncbi:hypothetical protein [Hymenobacter coccineus]|uniref:Uncharacterized protein n=1 Tax=Hymenobacter coccineus TaxID=1908235 RepID=A0A1G1SWA2_9BACT|nr:hypothetical protein [Hymenobacter coccineus]OGX82895.1 hypothetical protein BEN49_13150 [Hymenobacter coccineus]